MLWRIDGVLHPVGHLPRAITTNVVSRLKVLAELLTYQVDVPQEGRIRSGDSSLDMRLSTFPTLFGEKAVVRILQAHTPLLRLADLGLPPTSLDPLTRALAHTSGVILVSGPAGSGKTTTLYACLRELVSGSNSPLSIVSLEDPVESVIAGVAQSQVRPSSGFDYATGLRSLMRQDPEVIMVGEIRDRETAEIVLQASLTGQLVLTTFHAGNACEAVGRLVDMGIEPYLVRSALLGILSQRLLRQTCPSCSGEANAPSSQPCVECHQTGYVGRGAIAEWLDPTAPAVAEAILARHDSHLLLQTAKDAGHRDLASEAQRAVTDGWTSSAEVHRVLGLETVAEAEFGAS